MIKFAIFLFCCAFLERILAETNDFQLFQDIVNSVNNALNNQTTFFGEIKQCYPDIGCFTLDGPMKHTGILPSSPDKVGTVFYAYTPLNPSTEHLIDAYQPATFGVIDSAKRLVVIIHGFSNSHTTAELVWIKGNLLAHSNGEVGSVITVDWKKGAAPPDYKEASTNTQVVGRQVAFLVNELKKHHGINPRHVYLIGFSLGAQVAGFAGKYSQSEYDWKFGRITGLDAAAPLFENHPGAYLTKDDAEFVDAIHTSAGNNILLGEVGFIKAYGHLDFYPNSGRNQPQCHNIFPLNCNHYGAVLFYNASLSARNICKFGAYPCADWDTFQTGNCIDSDVELGYWADKTHAKGNYFLTTTAEYPFC